MLEFRKKGHSMWLSPCQPASQIHFNRDLYSKMSGTQSKNPWIPEAWLAGKQETETFLVCISKERLMEIKAFKTEKVSLNSIQANKTQSESKYIKIK